MMEIVSSKITYDHDRGNGTRSVHVEHLDSRGVTHCHRFICALDYDAETHMAEHALEILQQVEMAELEAAKIEQEELV